MLADRLNTLSTAILQDVSERPFTAPLEAEASVLGRQLLPHLEARWRVRISRAYCGYHWCQDPVIYVRCETPATGISPESGSIIFPSHPWQPFLLDAHEGYPLRKAIRTAADATAVREATVSALLGVARFVAGRERLRDAWVQGHANWESELNAFFPRGAPWRLHLREDQHRLNYTVVAGYGEEPAPPRGDDWRMFLEPEEYFTDVHDALRMNFFDQAREVLRERSADNTPLGWSRF